MFPPVGLLGGRKFVEPLGITTTSEVGNGETAPHNSFHQALAALANRDASRWSSPTPLNGMIVFLDCSDFLAWLSRVKLL
jgi:hypothetical protein